MTGFRHGQPATKIHVVPPGSPRALCGRPVAEVDLFTFSAGRRVWIRWPLERCRRCERNLPR
jgi:hypothetical protein